MIEPASDYIDEATTLAFGRAAWTAINVEDSARRIAQQILQEEPGRTPARAFIVKAIDKLKELEQDVTTRLGIQYLSESIDALATRNTILHSIPVVSYGHPTPEHSLLHFPNNGREPTMTPRQASTLNAYADKFSAIYRDAPQAFRLLYSLSPDARAKFESQMHSDTEQL